MFERELVREPVGCAAEDRRVAAGVQPGAATQLAGLSNASGVRATRFARLRARRSAAQTRKGSYDLVRGHWGHVISTQRDEVVFAVDP